MKRLFHPQLALILLFLGMIGSVPIVQIVLELRRGERPQLLDILKSKATAENLRAYERRLEDANWLAARVRPWAEYAQFAWFKDGGQKAVVGRDGWLFYGPGVQYLTERPGARQPGSSAAEAVAAIIDLRNQLAARGIRLLVMPVPNKESVYPEKLTWRGSSLGTPLCPETKEVFNRLKEAGVDVVDLFELFMACKTGRATSSAPVYLARDSHWSPAGVELAAHTVAERILSQGWVKTGAVPYVARPSPTRRTGDILRMLQLPPLTGDTLTETVDCSQVLRSDTGERYRDLVDSEILILGDSFLRIYQTDEPGAAGFIAHLSRELRQAVTSIINDGGASTLVRQELSRRPTWLANKKVVIWEFVERDIRLGTEGWQLVPLPKATAGLSLTPGRGV